MLFSTWIVYIFVALMSIASPGPAILLAISNSLKYGMRTVIISSFGNIVGLFFLSALAMAGVGAFLKTSPSMFFILKFCGAAYLFYLGVKQWRSRKSVFSQIEDATKESKKNSNRGRFQLFTQAYLLAITNPKAILFFSALFPQFISAKSPLLPQFFILTFTLWRSRFAL